MSEDWEDEEWDDDNGEGEATGPCPECAAELHVDAENCYACGHWLTTAERHKIWDGGSRSKQFMSTGKWLLVVVLVVLFAGSMFGIIR